MVITDGWVAARCGGRIGVATMVAATGMGVTTIDRLTAITVAWAAAQHGGYIAVTFDNRHAFGQAVVTQGVLDPFAESFDNGGLDYPFLRRSRFFSEFLLGAEVRSRSQRVGRRF